MYFAAPNAFPQRNPHKNLSFLTPVPLINESWNHLIRIHIPDIIDEVSKEYGVATNNIFIGAPEEKLSFSVQDLGGVRVIF